MKSGKVVNKEQQKPPNKKPGKQNIPEKIEKPKTANEAKRKQQRLSIDFDKQYRQIIFKKCGVNQNAYSNLNPDLLNIELNYQCKSSQDIDLDEEETKNNIQIKKKQLKLQFLEEIEGSPNQKHSPNFQCKPQKGIIKMPKEGTIQLDLLKLTKFDDEDDSFEKMFKEIEQDCQQKEEKVDPLKNLLQTINSKDNKNEEILKLKNAEESYKIRKKQLLQNIQAIKDKNTKPENEQLIAKYESDKNKQSLDLDINQKQSIKKFSLDINNDE